MPETLASIYEEPSQKDKLWNKSKEAPFVPIGIAATLAMIGYGAYSFRNKGNISTSLYLMQLRVKSQSMIVGAITLGVAYSLLKDHVFTSKEKSTSK